MDKWLAINYDQIMIKPKKNQRKNANNQKAKLFYFFKINLI